MLKRSKMELIEHLTKSLSESVEMYDASKSGEFYNLYVQKENALTSKLPPTKTAIQRKITLLREELLNLSKDL